ncbi:MAG: LytTR family DNA-binding domain-containing protein [Bacteroidota bacterium]
MTCLVVDDDPIARSLVARFAERHDALDLVGTCEDAVEAANVLARRRTEGAPVELVFLDVEMPEMTGLELAEALGVAESRPQVVLITSKEEYAREAFEVEATDYLVKPPTYGRFVRAVERVLARAASAPPAEPEPPTDPNTLFVKADGRLVRLDLREVGWIEAQKDYVLFHSESGDHLVHSTMKALAERLPDPFVRVHRSYFVRVDRIGDVEDSSLVIGRKVIPVGATYRAKLLARLNTL